MTEPFRAGDSYTLGYIAFDGYSHADGWTISYILNSPTARATLPGRAALDNIGFFATFTPDETSKVPPGTYDLFAVLTKGNDRATRSLGSLTVLPDIMGALTGVDTRSFAKKTLDMIESALSGDTSMLVQSYEIHGRKIEYIDRAKLLQYRAQFQQEYNNERIASGEIVRSNTLRISM